MSDSALEFATVAQLLGELHRRHKTVVCIRLDHNGDVMFDVLGGTITALGMIRRAEHAILNDQVTPMSERDYMGDGDGDGMGLCGKDGGG